MPRFILYRQKPASKPRPQDLPAAVAGRDSPPTGDTAPDELRSDSRVTIVDEMPRMVLIDCAEDVAAEWQAKMPGWNLQREQRAKVPDPRPRPKSPLAE